MASVDYSTSPVAVPGPRADDVSPASRGISGRIVFDSVSPMWEDTPGRKYHIMITKYLKDIMEAKKQIYDILSGTDEKEIKMLFEAFHAFASTSDVIQNFIGYMYAEGRGVAKNYHMAMRWYLTAAYNNNPSAQYNVAKMYHKGIGVKVDYGQAIRWYKLAAAKDHPKSKTLLVELIEMLRNNDFMIKIIVDQATKIDQLEMDIDKMKRSVAKKPAIPGKAFSDWEQF
ncbi:MAG: hypothetical protein Harvfovirus13_5 [Harvfovirus sp.]|uniref:Sel1 repeat family protein n=1 Tax=Harvfovirus sp. TaxID=2487768 RepID=A0A3G5A693_9VIRU|nr:MAG: hypothetical protein Harvfovirus13_5 [Harvfovirus sp.]